ncbi:site-specific integrase [Actinomadura xylanilytica]|uniref:site-specific integrase n=1 Tax=Actinomadura xylanilytica TaxID=887459 RepID=UPI00255B3752|nr:site-specific integrase [Actinomadura xylanilytica]MDL4777397.1 site-specific integrase [Actinomadura xylanilytica]
MAVKRSRAMGLELDAIDFQRREVDISQQLKAVSGRKPYLALPKTKTSMRTVELPEVTAVALARHIEQYPPVEVEIVDETDPRRPRTRMAKLVFLWGGDAGARTKNLTPIYRSSWSRPWKPAARAAGVPEGVGLHCLRHYFATLLIHQGASVKTVQLALGHANPMITLNEYVGEWPEAYERTRSIVDSALGHVPRLCPAQVL